MSIPDRSFQVLVLRQETNYFVVKPAATT
ncbi:unnamed protein product [Linum tenue]|uniref:Uncharacterized protein n=1 Tax=Linum tenue TaxID=586396 RepID=A0AAV0J2M1_9ROSI|nr:unnamed protein product [Linum tenue]CAI0403275.1 unnamed protein product [Linum tenue]